MSLSLYRALSLSLNHFQISMHFVMQWLNCFIWTNFDHCFDDFACKNGYRHEPGRNHWRCWSCCRYCCSSMIWCNSKLHCCSCSPDLPRMKMKTIICFLLFSNVSTCLALMGCYRLLSHSIHCLIIGYRNWRHSGSPRYRDIQ